MDIFIHKLDTGAHRHISCGYNVSAWVTDFSRRAGKILIHRKSHIESIERIKIADETLRCCKVGHPIVKFNEGIRYEKAILMFNLPSSK